MCYIVLYASNHKKLQICIFSNIYIKNNITIMATKKISLNELRSLVRQIINEENESENRLKQLNDFFNQGGTGREKGWLRDFYIHFKQGGSVDNLEPNLKKVYLESPGIFNFSSFSKEQVVEIIEDLSKLKDDSTFLEKPNFNF